MSGDADFRTVIWYLGQRQVDGGGGDGEGTWLFPRLRDIDLHAVYGNQSVVALRQMVQDRWVKQKDDGSGTRPEGYVEVKLPVRKGGKRSTGDRSLDPGRGSLGARRRRCPRITLMRR